MWCIAGVLSGEGGRGSRRGLRKTLLAVASACMLCGMTGSTGLLLLEVREPAVCTTCDWLWAAPCGGEGCLTSPARLLPLH